jgi:hypothetical protein
MTRFVFRGFRHPEREDDQRHERRRADGKKATL